MILTPEQLKIVTEWWAQAICSPKFDNGDDSESGGMAFALATIASKPVADDQAENFKVALAKELEEFDPRYDSLDVDYGPCQQIANAMKAAGISINNAPWKTRMMMIDGGVSVWHGYRAPEQVLLAKTVLPGKD